MAPLANTTGAVVTTSGRRRRKAAAAILRARLTSVSPGKSSLRTPDSRHIPLIRRDDVRMQAVDLVSEVNRADAHRPLLGKFVARALRLKTKSVDRRARRVDLSSMCEAMRVVVGRLNRNGRGGRMLDHAMVAGHVIVTTLIALASAGVKLPMF